MSKIQTRFLSQILVFNNQHYVPLYLLKSSSINAILRRALSGDHLSNGAPTGAPKMRLAFHTSPIPERELPYWQGLSVCNRSTPLAEFPSPGGIFPDDGQVEVKNLFPDEHPAGDPCYRGLLIHMISIPPGAHPLWARL